MKKIKLTQGKFALVDDEDFGYLNQWKWHYDSSVGYARRTQHIRVATNLYKQKRVYMHGAVNCAPTGLVTDHINRDRLDNRKCNLRSVTSLENNRNRGLAPNNTSGYKGVSWSKVMNKWESYIWINNSKISLGYYDNAIDAYSVRVDAERIHYV